MGLTSMERHFVFQIRLDGEDVAQCSAVPELKDLIRSAGGQLVEETTESDEGGYANLDVTADRPAEFWARLNAVLPSRPGVVRSPIVVYSGRNGWDDYLLLRHFDGDQIIDPLSDDLWVGAGPLQPRTAARRLADWAGAGHLVRLSATRSSRSRR